jgi:hypothetical protein
MKCKRIILAFLVSPLIAPLTFLFAFIFRSSPPPSASGLPVIFALYAPFAYAATAVLGIPMFFVFRALRWTNVLAYILGGALMGLVTSSVVFGLLINWTVGVGVFVWCAVAGAWSASVFWLVVYGFQGESGAKVSINGET